VNILNAFKLNFLVLWSFIIMNRFNTVIAIAVLSISTLTACSEDAKNAAGGAKDSVTQTAGNAADKATEGTQKAANAGKDGMTGTMDKAKSMAGNVMAMKDGAPAMITGVNATIAAVKAKDFPKAKDEVTKLQGTWGKMRESVEKKSPEKANAINAGLDKAQTELSEPKPEADKVMASLNSITGPLKTLVAMK
jgi:hypothetical protein